MNSSQILETTDRCTTPNYARAQVAFVRGEGRRLWDANGKVYLDLLAGLGVSSLGHGHPGLIAAVNKQASSLLHTSNLYYHEPGAALAERLVAETFADRVFFCNSGAEANEAAIKMARRAAGDRKTIISVHGSFHGRTLGALAATGQPNLHEGFGPMPGGFIHVAHGDLVAVKEAMGADTAAVLVEPILGEGGVLPLPEGYLKALRALCDEAGALLILDEVQTGNGRTGKLYCHEHEGIQPDILTTAKGLAGGLPIGAVLATEAVGSVFVPGTHGTTFGANPVSCAAGLVVLEELRNGVTANAREVGGYLRNKLEALAQDTDKIVDVRGQGLMLGVVLSEPSKPYVDQLLANGVIANATAGTVLRLLPPLTLTQEEADEAVAQIAEVLK
jgi:acetylornithine/N-succinyldiaminopimelate aminotransferase